MYSAPSFTEVAREGADAVRWNMLHPTEKPRVPYIAQVMNDAPAVAATDYMKLFAEQVRAFIPAQSYHVLGTDGFGRSDSVKTYVNTSKWMRVMLWLQHCMSLQNKANLMRKWSLMQSQNLV